MSRKQRYYTFDELARRQTPSAFATMVKPVGSRCNLDCAYCYYLDKEAIYAGIEPQMDDALLERYIRQYIEGNRVDTVTFVWHGGEPTLAGLDFFRRAVALQQRHAGGKRIENALQTNGTLLDDDWCAFLRDNRFLVGISLDGPASIHDRCRRDKGGRPTFARVAAAVERLRRHGVEFNTMTTVNRYSEGRGREVYRFLKSLGSRYMQFMPVVEQVCDPPHGGRPGIVAPGTPGSRPAEWSVTSRGFGEFMCEVFDDWVLSDVGDYFVQFFDVSLAQWVGIRPPLCSFCETCGDSLVVEHNGDIYSCDHFVYPEYRLGNIRDTPLSEIYRSRKRRDFGLAKRNALPAECLRCNYYFACRGECPKHRFETGADGCRKNSLCEGLLQYFRHAEPYMDYMRGLLGRNQPPAWVMPFARQRMGLVRP